MKPSRTTLILFGVTLAAFLVLGALPSTRITYHRWQRDRCGKALSVARLNGSKLSSEEETRLFHWIEYHQRHLVALGSCYEGRFTLERLKGNHEAFSRLHRQFAAANTGRSASSKSHAPDGTFVIWDDDPRNQAKWERFVTERDTAEFAASTAAE